MALRCPYPGLEYLGQPELFATEGSNVVIKARVGLSEVSRVVGGFKVLSLAVCLSDFLNHVSIHGASLRH